LGFHFGVACGFLASRHAPPKMLPDFFFAFFPEYIIGNWSRVEWCGVQRSGCQGCIVRWSDCSLPALFITVWMDRWMAGRMGWMWMGGCRSGWAGSGCRIYLPWPCRSEWVWILVAAACVTLPDASAAVKVAFSVTMSQPNAFSRWPFCSERMEMERETCVWGKSANDRRACWCWWFYQMPDEIWWHSILDFQTRVGVSKAHPIRKLFISLLGHVFLKFCCILENIHSDYNNMCIMLRTTLKSYYSEFHYLFSVSITRY